MLLADCCRPADGGSDNQTDRAKRRTETQLRLRLGADPRDERACALQAVYEIDAFSRQDDHRIAVSSSVGGSIRSALGLHDELALPRKAALHEVVSMARPVYGAGHAWPRTMSITRLRGASSACAANNLRLFRGLVTERLGLA